METQPKPQDQKIARAKDGKENYDEKRVDNLIN